MSRENWPLIALCEGATELAEPEAGGHVCPSASSSNGELTFADVRLTVPQKETKVIFGHAVGKMRCVGGNSVPVCGSRYPLYYLLIPPTSRIKTIRSRALAATSVV